MIRDFQSLRQPNHWVREARLISLQVTEPADYISVVSRLARIVTSPITIICRSGPGSGNCEALSTAALIGSVGIVKLKSPVQATLREINA